MARPENKYLLEQFMETSTAEVIAINRATGEELFFGTLESDELSHEVETEEIKGGIWNDTITTINKNKTIKFKVTDVCSRMDVQMNKLGATIKTADNAVQAWHFPKNYEVVNNVSTKEITLPETPKKPDELTIYNTKTNRVLALTTDYTLSGKTVTILSADINVGDNVFVTSYQYDKTGIDYADISGQPLPQSYVLIVRKPLFDTDDTVVCWKQYFFPKAKMSGSFTLSGQTEKTKNAEDTEFTIEKDSTYDYLGRIMFIPEVDTP